MAKKATTKFITNGQIGQINNRLATKLRASGLLSESVQKVLKMPGNAALDEMIVVFRKHVEAVSSIIIRHARVDRALTPQEAIDATGRMQYIDPDVLATMPRGEGDEVDVHFVPTGRLVPVGEYTAFLAQYGLVPDPRAQAAVNAEYPAFADEHPNCSQWGDSCYLVFRRWLDGRRVDCDRNDDDWDDNCWLAGVPAS